MDCIHAELELLAREFDQSPPGERIGKAGYLIWFMENYPNAELWRALPFVEKNFLEGPAYRKCARMLGQIGSRKGNAAASKRAIELLLDGAGSAEKEFANTCIRGIGKIASRYRWQDFDFVIQPLLELAVDSKHLDWNPDGAEAVLDALGGVKPNSAKCLELMDEAKREIVRQKGTDWGNRVRRIEGIRGKWELLLMQRGVIEKDDRKEYALMRRKNGGNPNPGRANGRKAALP